VSTGFLSEGCLVNLRSFRFLRHDGTGSKLHRPGDFAHLNLRATATEAVDLLHGPGHRVGVVGID